jgi:hypothetical protein
MTTQERKIVPLAWIVSMCLLSAIISVFLTVLAFRIPFLWRFSNLSADVFVVGSSAAGSQIIMSADPDGNGQILLQAPDRKSGVRMSVAPKGAPAVELMDSSGDAVVRIEAMPGKPGRVVVRDPTTKAVIWSSAAVDMDASQPR